MESGRGGVSGSTVRANSSATADEGKAVDVAAVLTDGFGRIRDSVHGVLDDLPADALTYRVGEGANTIAWLIWHLTRVQDDHVADVAGAEQVWTAQGWYERFALPF